MGGSSNFLNTKPTIMDKRSTFTLRASSTLFSNVKSRLKNLYVPKCICVVSLYPYYLEFSKILKTIFKYSKSGRLKKPIEKIIENLVVEVPIPPRGIYAVEYQLFNEKYILTQTKLNNIPFMSLEFEKIFINFKLEQILEIYKHMLLETRIIFFSSDCTNLNPIILGLSCLTYPLKYQFQFVTILPQDNFVILESPSPYIVGINSKYDPGFFDKYDIDVNSLTYLIVDIDMRKIELVSPNLKQINDSQRKKFMMEEFPDLPKHYKDKLLKSLSNYLSRIKSYNKEKENREQFTSNIRNCFFQFIVNILQNYNNHLNLNYYTDKNISTPSVNNLFKTEEYIFSVESGDRPFYRKFVNETQQFVDFIYKRMIPKDSKEKLEILFFDENIIEKNNRKLFSKKLGTTFIHTNNYDIKNVYQVTKHRSISEKEIEFFRTAENRREALKYGQEVTFENGEIFFSYPYFPTLMSDFYIQNSIKQYLLPPNLSDELEPINVESVSISHLANVSIHQTEMENFIYLCWLQLWAMTFWYQEEEERRYRFQQLLQVLDMVRNHEVRLLY